MINIEKDNEKPVIIIEEKPDVIPGQGEGEVPVITVERDDTSDGEDQEPKPVRRLPWVVGSVLFTALLCVAFFYGRRYYNTYIDIGIPVSVSSEENITKLMQSQPDGVLPEVIKTSDSILGVALNFYEMRGLRAEIAMFEPDTTDTEVFLYSRCSDYHPDFSIIGSLVIDGEEKKTVDRSRLGYFAGAGDNYVIGIARDEDVKDYVKDHGGCFFRQYILLSSGVMPRQYYLHGKVERRGIGRMPDGTLYYLETLHKETMWDFADALREYGFVDAIYITGGNDYCFYRDSEGVRHDIGNLDSYPHKYPGQVPWLIFKKR